MYYYYNLTVVIFKEIGLSIIRELIVKTGCLINIAFYFHRFSLCLVKEKKSMESKKNITEVGIKKERWKEKKEKMVKKKRKIQEKKITAKKKKMLSTKKVRSRKNDNDQQKWRKEMESANYNSTFSLIFYIYSIWSNQKMTETIISDWR